MTTPITPSKSHSPLPSGSPEGDSKLQDAVAKVVNVNHLLSLPNVMRAKIVANLTENDLDALEISLSKGDEVEKAYQPAQKHLHDLVIKTRQNLVFQNLLKDHPDWKLTVEAWSVPVEDKIWLMRIYELYILGEDLPGIRELYPQYTSTQKCLPSVRSPELLQKREEITKRFGEITEISWFRRGLIKCPDGICLLGNLKKLALHSNDLRVPPDVRLNIHLEELEVSGNNALTDPPDLRRNEKLRVLNLYGNRLKKPPNLEKNVLLQVLDLRGNDLTEAPDLSRNVKIWKLDITNNQLTVSPDLRSLENLQRLLLGENQIVQPPDLQNNLKLKYLDLSKNKMKTLPDTTRHPDLKDVACFGNPFSNEEKQKVEEEMKERGIQSLI